MNEPGVNVTRQTTPGVTVTGGISDEQAAVDAELRLFHGRVVDIGQLLSTHLYTRTCTSTRTLTRTYEHTHEYIHKYEHTYEV